MFFRRIAVPRRTGTAALRDVERIVAERLLAAGFQVRREPFSASQGRLIAPAIAGAGLGWIAVLTAPLLTLASTGWPVSLGGFAALAFIALLAGGIASGVLPNRYPPIDAANLVAVRGTPRLWLVAHADSKGQRFSLRGRIMASGLATLGVVGLIALLLVRLAGPVPPAVVWPVAACAIVGGATLSLMGREPASDTSPGAVDNATGMVAALAAAEVLAPQTEVGVLITGAEEFGMEGARAWIAGEPREGTFVNFDGIDSRGAYTLHSHAAPASLDIAIRTALQADDLRVRRAALPFGIFVDGAVLMRGGLKGLTVSRGDWSTLGVIHTPADTPDRVDAEAARAAGRAVARALVRLTT